MEKTANTETKIIVRYAETDQMGFAHHSCYPIWYEAARTNFIKTIGITYSEMEHMGIMTPLVDLFCKYIKPAFYEDELTIKVSVQELGIVKIKFGYEIYRDNELLNTGYTTHAWVGTDKKPINLKKHFPEIYEKIALLENKSE